MARRSPLAGAGHATAGRALLTHEEVLARAERFRDLVKRERELQEFLLRLRFHGDSTQVQAQRQQYDDALAEIHRIRMEEIVPLVAELGAFLAEVRGREAGGASARTVS